MALPDEQHATRLAELTRQRTLRWQTPAAKSRRSFFIVASFNRHTGSTGGQSTIDDGAIHDCNKMAGCEQKSDMVTFATAAFRGAFFPPPNGDRRPAQRFFTSRPPPPQRAPQN